MTWHVNSDSSPSKQATDRFMGHNIIPLKTFNDIIMSLSQYLTYRLIQRGPKKCTHSLIVDIFGTK
jgi:hypothetical protein